MYALFVDVHVFVRIKALSSVVACRWLTLSGSTAVTDNMNTRVVSNDSACGHHRKGELQERKTWFHRFQQNAAFDKYIGKTEFSMKWFSFFKCGEGRKKRNRVKEWEYTSMSSFHMPYAITEGKLDCFRLYFYLIIF